MKAGDLVQAVCAWLIVLSSASASLMPLDLVTFTMRGGTDRRCGRIAYIEANGPGGVPYAWLTVGERAPVWLAHLPMASLTAGCAA